MVAKDRPTRTAGWRESLSGVITPPVVAEGIVAVADVHRHRLLALDPATGWELWRRNVGGRIDTPPTIYKGICIFGSHDGNIYALNARDGRTVWQMRAAPQDARMMSYGQVASPWPVIGSVLVSRGVAYASAGQTTGSEGGIVLRKFEPISGKHLATHVISTGPHLNDIITACDAGVHLMRYQDHPPAKAPKDKEKGKAQTPAHLVPAPGLEGIMRGN